MVLDPEAHTVQLGTGTTDYFNAYKDGLDAYDTNATIVVPATVQDTDGVTWTVSSVGQYAFAYRAVQSTTAGIFVRIIFEGDLDYVGKLAFRCILGEVEFQGAVKQIEGAAYSYFNQSLYIELEYPEGSEVVYGDGSHKSGQTGDCIVGAASGGYLSFPFSHNGDIVQDRSYVDDLYIKSPYANLIYESSDWYSIYDLNSTQAYVKAHFWAGSHTSETWDEQRSEGRWSRATPCAMAVLSDEFELSLVTPPEGTSDEDLYPESVACNTSVVGIQEGGKYGQAPSVTITCTDEDYGWTLTEDTDFTAVYFDESGAELDEAPTLPGTYSVKYVGNELGVWGETDTYTFIIDPDIAGAEITVVGATEFTYTGEGQAPQVEVTLDGRDLVDGSEYVVSYLSTDGVASNDAPSAPGSYLAVVSAKSPMEGGIIGQIPFTISSIDLSECTVVADNLVATGSAQAPVVEVRTADGAIVSSSAYTLDLSTVTDLGNYTVTVTGDGVGCFNSVTDTFSVVEAGHALTSVEVTTDPAFTGTAVTPSFTVVDAEGNSVGSNGYTVTYYEAVDDGEGGYVPGEEIAAADLVDVGTYIAVVKGAGTDYAGTVRCVFEIAPQEVTDVSAVTVNRTDYDYIPSRFWLDPDTPILRTETAILRGEYITPDVTVTLADGTELVEGVDYTLNCVNNTGDDKDNYAQLNKWTAAFTVELCGNYSGTIGTIDENDYANSTFVFYISQRQRVYEYHGIRFTYAIDNDGNAIITGLDEDMGTYDAFTDAFDGETAYIPDTIVTAEGDVYPVDRVAENAFSGYGISDPQFPSRNTPTWESATKLVVEGIREVDSTGTAGNITELELQEGIEVIGCGAISWGSTNVPDIVIPSSVVAIGSNAFGGNNQTTAVLNSVTFVQPSSFTTYFPQVGTTTESGEYRYWMPDSVVSYPLFTAGTNAGSPGTITTFTIPASFKGNDVCLFDRAVTLTDVYVLADDYDPSRSPVDARVEMNLWGWDIEGSGVYEISQSTTYDFVWSPFAVLGDGYVYTNAWNEETQCCNGEQFYDSNVSLVDATVTNTGDAVRIDWSFDYNYVNKSSRTISEGEDFTVTYVKEGTDEVLEEITEPGTYTATLTGNGINCFGTDSIVIEVPAAGVITDSDVSVSADGLTYTGSALEPAVTVTVNGALLARGTDYEISYANNVYAGTATVTVTGIGLYEGNVTATFNIAKAQASVKAADLSKAYGADDPTFIWADVEGLVAGDKLLSATFTRAPGEDAGEYAITMTDAVIVGDGVVVSDCYDITYAPGTLTILPATESATANTMNVYAGDDRYDTASRINSSVAEEGSYAGVIVCSGANGKFADALAASGLSGVLDYPIVLTDGSAATLPADTAQSISALIGGAQANIIVLGGEGTVSSGIYSALSAYGTVERIAGDDRYATAEAVYEYGTAHGGWSSDYAVVAIGNNFPDALGAASFCTTYGAPMLLTNSNDDSLAAYITEAASAVSEVVIVGGESSVSASKESALKGVCSNVERMAGNSRYDTNVAFASWQIAHGMTADGAGIATGANFPDSLGSSYLLSLTSSVLLLASSDEAENAGLYALLSDNADTVTSVSVLGGPNSVTASTRLATQTTVGGAWVIVNK